MFYMHLLILKTRMSATNCVTMTVCLKRCSASYIYRIPKSCVCMYMFGECERVCSMKMSTWVCISGNRVCGFT